MIIGCFRCGKELNSPNASNADYVIARDTKMTDIQDGLPAKVQKTAVICPECCQDADFVIWGVHKKQEQEAKR